MREDQDPLEELEVINESLSTMTIQHDLLLGYTVLPFLSLLLGPRERFLSVNRASFDTYEGH